MVSPVYAPRSEENRSVPRLRDIDTAKLPSQLQESQGQTDLDLDPRGSYSLGSGPRYVGLKSIFNLTDLGSVLKMVPYDFLGEILTCVTRRRLVIVIHGELKKARVAHLVGVRG